MPVLTSVKALIQSKFGIAQIEVFEGELDETIFSLWRLRNHSAGPILPFTHAIAIYKNRA